MDDLSRDLDVCLILVVNIGTECGIACLMVGLSVCGMFCAVAELSSVQLGRRVGAV